jgi:hypothetical protein
MAQPILLNNSDPFSALEVCASFESRAGAFEARMKRAKWSISSSPSGPDGSLGDPKPAPYSGDKELVKPLPARLLPSSLSASENRAAVEVEEGPWLSLDGIRS